MGGDRVVLIVSRCIGPGFKMMTILNPVTRNITQSADIITWGKGRTMYSGCKCSSRGGGGSRPGVVAYGLMRSV